MKQPKKLSRKQKIMLVKNGYDPEAWMCVSDTDQFITICSKENNRHVREISKRRY